MFVPNKNSGYLSEYGNLVPKPTAKIAINKNVCKENNGVVYLKNQTEYSIELYNPTTERLGVSITIDGKYLGNMLVLRPAERVFLERFFDTDRKFKFSTYSVENTEENQKIIESSQNGKISIAFHKEIIPQKFTKSLTRGFQPDINTFLYNPFYNVNLNTFETGNTEMGDYSNQKFDSVNIDFCDLSFHVVCLQILPESLKQYTSENIVSYCTECGLKKRHENWKFCPKCGNKF